MQAVMLAAGRGTRLRPITDRYSKAMVPVVGRPLADRVLETLVANGVRDVVMVIGPDDPEIRDFFTRRTALDVTVEFVVQEERLGMAHALGLAAPLIRGPFVLSACDSIKSAAHVGDLMARAATADGALSLLEVPWDRVSRSAPVDLEGDLVRRIVEKPSPEDAPSNIVSLPLYVLPRRILDVLDDLEVSERGEYELQGAIQTVIDEGARILGVRAGNRVQVSSVEDLLALSLQLLESGDEGGPGAAPTVGAGTSLHEPLWIAENVVVGRDCSIGPRVSIDRGCRIGDGVRLRDAVLLPGVVIPRGEDITNRVITS